MRESEFLEGDNHLLVKFGSLPFLRSIDKKYLKDIINRSKMRTYEPGEVITNQGSYEAWVYIILTGEVAVIRDDNEIATLDMPGDTFGEMALIDGQERSATVKSIEGTVCLAIDTSFLDTVDREKYLSFYAVFYQLFAKILARRLRETNDELVSVKRELTDLKRYYGGE